MNKFIKLLAIILLTAFMSTAFTGCGGSDGEAPSEPIGDLSGSWSVIENVDARDCGEGIFNDYYTVVVTNQTATSVTVATNSGTHTGSISGNNLSWSGSYNDDWGTTTSETSLTVNPDCNSLYGTATWRWSDSYESCSGTSTVTATRDIPVGCGEVQ